MSHRQHASPRVTPGREQPAAVADTVPAPGRTMLTGQSGAGRGDRAERGRQRGQGRAELAEGTGQSGAGRGEGCTGRAPPLSRDLRHGSHFLAHFRHAGFLTLAAKRLPTTSHRWTRGTLGAGGCPSPGLGPSGFLQSRATSPAPTQTRNPKPREANSTSRKTPQVCSQGVQGKAGMARPPAARL